MDKMSRIVAMVAVGGVLSFGINVLAQEAKEPGAPNKGKGGHRNPEEMFQKMDANHDGAVTKEEFIAAHEARVKPGRPAPAKEIQEQRFAALDSDADGKLTQAEFSAGVAKMKGPRGKGAPVEVKPAEGDVKNAAPADTGTK